MRNIFAVARLTPVLSFVVVAILVFSIFALLKISSGGKQEPGQELLTGSNQKSPAVRKPPSDDPVASFVAPSSFQPTLRRGQMGVVVRTPVHGEFVNSRTNASARVGLVRYRHSASVRIHDSPAHARGTPVGHHRQTRAPGRDTCG